MRIVNPKISTRADWEKSWGGGFYTKDSSAGNQACQDRANYINKTLEHLGVTPQVLADVGCGNGMFAQALLEYYPNTRMIMIDWSTTALNIAKERLSGFIERCIFIQQDTSKLEAPIDADVFLSMGVIEHYDDPLAQLDILVRQMPDHAYLVLMTPNSRSMVVASRWILQLRKKWTLGLQREYGVDYLEDISTKAGLKVLHKEALLRRKIPEDGLLGKLCNYTDHIVAKFVPRWGWYSFVFCQKL